MTFIDTHAHLYSEQFEGEKPHMLERARAAGIEAVYLPNIDLDSVQALHHLEQMSNGLCLAMMGLHPCSVKADYQEVLAELKKYLYQRPYIAVGEIGIDLYWDKTTLVWQSEAFAEQLHWANEFNLPVSIHSREANQEVLTILEANKNILTGGVMHCFSGDIEEAHRTIELGYLLGIGGPVTYKKSSTADVIKEIDLKHIVLETDAPFLPPVPFRGKRNESAYIPYIAQQIAEVKNLPVEEVALITTANAKKLFKNLHINQSNSI